MLSLPVSNTKPLNNQSLLPSTTKHCVICKHTPEPSMKSATTTQISLPVTTLVMKTGLPETDENGLPTNLSRHGFLPSHIQSGVTTDLRDRHSTCAGHPSLSYGMVYISAHHH